jgi:hypothetical protein
MIGAVMRTAFVVAKVWMTRAIKHRLKDRDAIGLVL